MKAKLRTWWLSAFTGSNPVPRIFITGLPDFRQKIMTDFQVYPDSIDLHLSDSSEFFLKIKCILKPYKIFKSGFQ